MTQIDLNEQMRQCKQSVEGQQRKQPRHPPSHHMERITGSWTPSDTFPLFFIIPLSYLRKKKENIKSKFRWFLQSTKNEWFFLCLPKTKIPVFVHSHRSIFY
jgi:hypothetical protein